MKKLGMAIMFACLAYSFIGVLPVNARVCFMVNGDCGQKITVKPKGCENLGGMEDCIKKGMLPDYESAKQCTSGGVVYTSKCLCNPDRFPYTEDGLKNDTYYEAGGESCKDRTGTHYAWKICRASYKYTLNQSDVTAIKNESPKYHNSAAVCENRSMVPYTTLGCDEKYGVSPSFSRYTKCVCDTSTYKYNSTNKGLYALSGVMCKGTDNVERYTALACPTKYPNKQCTGDLIVDQKMPNTGEANFDCYTCKCAAKFEYATTLGNNISGSGNQCDTKWDNYTCPTTYPLKTCTDTTTYACERITSTVNSKAVCYKQVKKPTCAEIGGLTLAEKNAETSAKKALYEYKTASQISVDDKGVGCYFRIPKTCEQLKYSQTKTEAGHGYNISDYYASKPLAGLRIYPETKTFPDAYTGNYAGKVSSRVCFRKHSDCVAGDALTTSGHCMPKTTASGIIGWTGASAYSGYDVNSTKIGMVISASASGSTISVKYIPLTDAGYYPKYKRWSPYSDGSGYVYQDNSGNKIELTGAFDSVSNMMNISQANTLISNLAAYKEMGGTVHNTTRTLVTNTTDDKDWKGTSSIKVRECYYVKNTATEGTYAYVRRVVLDPNTNGVVSVTNKKNPRFLYGVHAYAEGPAAHKVLYDEDADGNTAEHKITMSKLNNFTSWDKDADVQPARIYRSFNSKGEKACGVHGASPQSGRVYVTSYAEYNDTAIFQVYYCQLPMYFRRPLSTCVRTHNADTGVPEQNCWLSQWLKLNLGDGFLSCVDNICSVAYTGDSTAKWGTQGCYVKSVETKTSTVSRETKWTNIY